MDPIRTDIAPPDFYEVGQPARASEIEVRPSLNGPIEHTNNLYGSMVIKD